MSSALHKVRGTDWSRFTVIFLVLFIIVGVAIISMAHRVQGLGPALTGSEYRFYDTSSSTTPGAPLASTSTASQLSTQGQSFRLRTGVTTRDNSVEVSYMSASLTASCAIMHGKIYCSGRNTNGELGDGTRNNTADFVPVATSTGLAGKVVTGAIGTGLGNNYITTCAVADGSIYCWGSNFYGTIGVNQNRSQLTDTALPMQAIMDGSLSGLSVATISAGSGHICGITTNGKAFCWGANGSGRLGDGTTVDRAKPTEVYSPAGALLNGKSVTSIGAGSGHGCAIADGSAYCWGGNSAGQLGNTSAGTQSTVPVAVDTSGPALTAGKTLVKLAVVLNSTCAIDTDGVTYCWGANSWAFGNGNSTSSTIPVLTDMSLVPAGGFKDIAAMEGNVCGIAKADSQLYCWGANGGGATGRGATNGATTRPTPITITSILAGKTVSTVSVGRGVVCGTTNSQEGFCFGYNPNGNFGLNDSTAQITTARAISTANFVPDQGVTVPTNTIATRLEYAAKTAGSCSAQTGFSPVTTTSPIAWSSNGSVSSGSAITATANDPVSGSATTLQTYVSDSATFDNPQAITPGHTGLWDLSLKDNSGLFNQTYCLRLAQSNGSAYTAYTAYPEITTAQGVLSVDIVDGGGNTVPAPAVAMPAVTVATTCQANSAILGTPSQVIRVNNDTTNPSWTLTIAATGGASASWQHSSQPDSYDYNDNNGSPPGCTSGLDGDGKAGLLTINPSAGSSMVTPKSGCSTTGITKGTSQSFIAGSINSITLLNASVSASHYCYWQLTGASMTQTIPAAQPSGTYTLDMTLTVLAQ